jgi:hypothetical protein
MTRLSGPTARESEEQVAEYIEAAVSRNDGRDLGTRTRRDGSNGLRVDFTYDTAIPPVAMEITALVEPEVRSLGAELLKLEASLQEIIRAEHLGSWMLGIRVGANVSRLRKPLIDLFRRNRGRSGVALFAADRAPKDVPDGDLVHLARLMDLGLVSALRMDGQDELSIFPPVANTLAADSGFGTLLRAAMSANVDKLHEAKPRQTHLVVTVDRSDLSPDPDRTPAPELIDGVDVLWVVLGYFNAKWTYRLWRTVGDRRWQLLEHPLGEPATLHPPPSPHDL